MIHLHCCLDVGISRVLETRFIGRHYLPSRINWVVQSTAVDFLHLLLVSMEWLMQEFGIKVTWIRPRYLFAFSLDFGVFLNYLFIEILMCYEN